MCIGSLFGGGRSRGPDPVAAAQEAERQRQQQIQGVIDQINQYYSGAPRETTYAQHEAATRDLNLDRLQEEAQGRSRQEKFRLARQGLTGGSAAADTQRALGEAVDLGRLRIGEHARSSAESLRSQDESAKQRATQLAQGGADVGTAQQVLTQGLRETQQQAASGQQFQGLADLFKNLGTQYYANAQAKGAQSAPPWWLLNQQWYGVNQPAGGYAGAIT